MAGFFYYLLTFAESVTSVFGVRSPYEQPHYVVIQDLGQNIELRQYEARQAIEATVNASNDAQAASEAFGLLFRYITGSNQHQQKIAMTVPVGTEAEQIAMTNPVQMTQTTGKLSMRFFLPKAVAEAGAPAPLDPRLHLVQAPPATIAALRYSGIPTKASRDSNAATLLQILAKTPWTPAGSVYQFSYDPPFTIPFLRRNEVAVTVTR